MEGTWENVRNRDVITAKGVLAGHDDDGSPVYIARGPFATQLIPGKLVVRADRMDFYCPYGRKESPVDLTLVEFLINAGYHWETNPRENGVVPANAIVGGRDEHNMALYIGRAQHQRLWIPGKIDVRNRCLFIPYGGNEIAISKYYVLVK